MVPTQILHLWLPYHPSTPSIADDSRQGVALWQSQQAMGKAAKVYYLGEALGKPTHGRILSAM